MNLIAIDLGLTNSRVAVLVDGEPVIVPFAEGVNAIPSTVTFVEGDELSPQDVISMHLETLKQAAEDYVGEEVDDVVIAVPAHFNDMQRSVTKEAGMFAALNVRRLINSPTAAALAYAYSVGSDCKLVVIHQDGDVFDVVLASVQLGVVEVLATSVNNLIGEGEGVDLEGPWQTVLDEAELSASDVDDVLLAGGMKGVADVDAKLQKVFGFPPSEGVNTEEAVVLGAAVQAGILRGGVGDLTVLDVTAYRVGIRVAGDRFSPVIPKNSPIPVRESKVFTTTEKNQDKVSITLLQGNADAASENEVLGTFDLKGIPRARAGTPRIKVTFEVDADGIVIVSAKDMATKVSRSIFIEGTSGPGGPPPDVA